MSQLYTFQGAERTLAEIAELAGIGYSILRNRVLVRNWTVEKATAVAVRQMNSPAEGTKLCAQCGQVKALTLFHPMRVRDKVRYGYCLECANHNNIAQADERRRKCIEHYSAGTNKCALCPESRIWVLDMDHVDGRDPGERKHGRPLHLARHLLKNGFPTGFRVLCRNCNWMEHLKRNKHGPFRIYTPLKAVCTSQPNVDHEPPIQAARHRSPGRGVATKL